MNNPILRDKDAPMNIGGIMVNDPSIMRGDEDFNPEKNTYSNPDEIFDPTAEDSAFPVIPKEEVKDDDVDDENADNKGDDVIEEDDKTKEEEELKTKDKPGDFKPEEQLDVINKAFDSNYESLDQATQEIKGFKTKIQELEQTNADLAKKAEEVGNPFINDEELAQLYHFKKTTGKGITDFVKIKDFNPESANPLELLVEDFLTENPKEDPKLVRKMFQTDYKLTPEHFRSDRKYEDLDDDEFNSSDIQAEIQEKISLNLLKLKREVAPIVNKYKEMQQKTVLPDFKAEREKTDSQARMSEANRLGTWDDKIKGKISNFKKYVDLEDGDNEPFVEMEVSDSQRVEIEKLAKDYIRRNRLDPKDDEHVKFIDDFILRTFEYKYKREIRKFISEESRRKADDEYAQRNGTKLPSKKNITDDKVDSKTKIEKLNQEAEEGVKNYFKTRYGR